MITPSFKATFDLTLSPKQLILTDTTDWASLGINTAKVNWVFQVVTSSGAVIYVNTDYSDSGCDIKVSTSLVSTKTIGLPVDDNGNVELGKYTVIGSVKDITSDPAAYYPKTNVYDNEYTQPDIDISQDVNIIGQVFSQTDTTNYVVNGITPTISRVNSLIYPQGVKGGAPPPYQVTTATLRTNLFYNGTQTSTILSAVTYVFADGLTVVDSIFGSKEILVDGSYYCSIACGLKAYEKKLCGCNAATKPIYEQNFKLAMSYVALIRLLIECNGGSGISCYLEKIKDIIGDCDCGCDDDDDKFSRVTGWAALIGVNGTDGDNGLSAYQIAVVNGFSGTEAQWLASLQGTNGTNGAIVINNDFVVNTPHTGGFASLKGYTLPANTLTNNGDYIQVRAIIKSTGDQPITAKMLIGGADAMPSLSPNYLPMPTGYDYKIIVATITRTSATTVMINYETQSTVSGFVSYGQYYQSFTEPSIAVNDLTTATNLIDIQGSAVSPSTIVSQQLTVTYFKNTTNA